MEHYRLRSYEFRKEREETWSALENLIEQVERGGLRGLSPEDLARLPGLYRATLSSLSVAKAISLDRNLIEYLEGLSRKAYFCVYATRRTLRTTLASFFTQRYPALVWRMRRNVVIAILLLVAGTAAGVVLTLGEPERFYSFVDDAYAQGRGPLSSREELDEILQGTEPLGALTAFATFLFTHNAKIGLLCYPLGFPAGVPVILLVFVTGLTLGSFIAIHVPHGLTLEFLAWVLPHGVTELLAVCVCAAAGLTVGESLIFPGRFRRIENLAQKGREAGTVVLGTVALFVLAAILEGFFRQLVHETSLRFTVAAVTVVFWAWYFGVYARKVAA